nr:ornithine cyclodeaminase family protein [Sphingomonas sp. Y57]
MHSPSSLNLRLIGGDIVRTILSMRECVDLMERAMTTISTGATEMPLRTVLPLPGANMAGVMMGYLGDPESLGAKLLSIYPGNPDRGLPSHTGVVILFDLSDGRPCALLDAAELTSLRTPAASAAATRALARSDAGDLAILGAGEQAKGHLEAMAIARPLRRVRLWGRNRQKAEAFARENASLSPVAIEICEDVEAAVKGADIICTTTGSNEPILRGAWLSPGTHVNLVGAGVRSAREADAAAVLRGRYFVDYRVSAMAQAGELLHAFEDERGAADHIAAEIGEVFAGKRPGRTGPDDITVYKSLGNAAQDLAASHAIYQKAEAQGLGTAVRF